ncbi:MAG: beta-aspartyl-peptidase [Gammaproteobacteria bacterium]|nr:beta-aspartyl-peptidase [Gammaproteobacteria bacterium]
MSSKLWFVLLVNFNLITANENFGIVVHGGAGVLSNLTKEQQNIIERELSTTLIVAYDMLKKGSSSLDVVEFAVSEFEDSPLFNAGRGSVYTSDETQEMDASIMYGLNRSAGAVASVKNIKNPIKLARKVFEQTEHVLLVGEGAESFAKSIGEATEDSAYFHSEKNLKRLRKVKNKITKNPLIQDKIGTVGAVALDKSGNISAATSTGGMTNKMPGRVGDTPIIGSGTWAQNKICGVSSTGHGEFFIKFQVAKEVCTRIEYLNQSLEESSQDIIDELKEIGATGGLIAIDKDANVSTPFNTDGMIRGSITNKSDLNVAIY